MNVQQQAMSNVLDDAIAQVGWEEYIRLNAGRPPTEVAKHVGQALSELRKFGQGAVPDFDDEWVSLFYVLWYHAKHTNLAYQMADTRLRMLGNGPYGQPTGTRLHIVDFGCGSLAMQFGAALAAADALARGQIIDSIRIEGLDDSAAMLRLGNWIWGRFVKLVH
jgi:hypothetical protein